MTIATMTAVSDSPSSTARMVFFIRAIVAIRVPTIARSMISPRCTMESITVTHRILPYTSTTRMAIGIQKEHGIFRLLMKMGATTTVAKMTMKMIARLAGRRVIVLVRNLCMQAIAAAILIAPRIAHPLTTRKFSEEA